MSKDLATARTVLDLIAEYDEKSSAVDTAIQSYEGACAAVEMAGTIMGTFVAPVIRGGKGYVHASDMRRNLLQSGWKAIYNHLQIDRIASANDKRLFERTLEDPPPLTFDNAKATFGPYLQNPRQHILRGLAETFSTLDPAYRSHSKVKVGVKGLPKRVIISNVDNYGSYGRDRLRDVLNALAAYQGRELVTYEELSGLVKDGETIRNTRDVCLKRYANGNGHLYFGPTALLDINRALAEFYGDVQPDVETEDARHAPSTAVSKDLQFYWSPDEVVSEALSFANVYDLRSLRNDPPAPMRVLEPSCGDGRIMDMIAAYGHRAFGIEYHVGRAAQAKAKGHNVLCANFLECPPRAEFDAVVMNPPFYGRHYVKHVRHALNFLRPGGTLVSILPASAHYDHRDLNGEWRDLPVASFAEAGTNIPTGMIRMRAP